MNEEANKLPVDVSRLQQSFADDLEFIIEMYQIYVEDAHKRLDSLDDALAKSDYKGIVDASHALKGSSANIGAERMSALASRLEQIDAAKDMKAAEELARELDAEFEAVEAFVQDYSHSVL